EGRYAFIFQKRFAITAQVAPCGVLGLTALREDEGVAPLMLTLVDRPTDQIVQCRDCLACAPMAHEYGPALLPPVKGLELVAGPISDLDDLTFTHWRYTR